MTIFFIGCTHFGHKNIITLANRPFASAEEMNAAMIYRWNKVVRPYDTVYHLGDFAFHSKSDKIKEINDRLNGTKHLILGNHDDLKPWEPLNSFENSGFSSIAMYGDLKYDDHRFILFHYPMEDWDGRYRGSIHLHAHTHSRQLERPLVPHIIGNDLENSGLILPANYPPDLLCNRFCVGAEAVNYTPISITDILRKSKGK